MATSTSPLGRSGFHSGGPAARAFCTKALPEEAPCSGTRRAMSNSWIPAWRKLYDPSHKLAPSKRDPASRRDAWLDLCQMAQHKPRRHRGVDLQTGEVLVAVRTKAEHWGWSKSRVSRFLLWLASEAMIGTVRGTPIGTVYRIVNYERYAIVGNGERDTSRDGERDRSGTGAGQEQPHNHRTTTTRTTYTSAFEQVWSVHRRGSKSKAFDAYRAAVSNGITHDDLLRHLRAYTDGFDKNFKGAHLFRWIREKRWEEQDRSGTRTTTEPQNHNY